MRRALALAAVVVSARQDHLCAEDVCFYHVPWAAWQPRDVEFHGTTFAYSKNEKSMKDKRSIEGTVAAARALKLHLRLNPPSPRQR